MKRYVVKRGDCLSLIAHRHGTTRQKLWDLPENRDLREKNRDPNVLYPGDIVWIPGIDPGDDDEPDAKRHRYRLKGEKTMIRLRLLDNHEPRANLSYTLTLDSGAEYSGTTDDDGKLEHPIRPTDRNATLIVEENGVRERYALGIGELDPVSEDSGVQQRLFNLAYFGDAIDGRIGDSTKDAIGAFQKKEGIAETKDADDATRARLEEAHGS